MKPQNVEKDQTSNTPKVLDADIFKAIIALQQIGGIYGRTESIISSYYRQFFKKKKKLFPLCNELFLMYI